jgi:hypothetical protein
MIVSRARNFVFVHVPKNGGTAFRSALTCYHDYPVEFWHTRHTEFLGIELDHAHLRSWEVRTFYPDVWTLMQGMQTLCFFRNPAERFVSAIYEHFRIFRQNVGLEALPWPEQQAVARDFASSVNMRDVFGNRFMVHFSPQTWFTHLNRQRVIKTIIPLIDDFDALRAARMMLGVPDIGPTPRTAPPRDPADLLGDNLLGHVKGMYRDDYAFCEATDNLRSLARP